MNRPDTEAAHIAEESSVSASKSNMSKSTASPTKNQPSPSLSPNVLSSLGALARTHAAVSYYHVNAALDDFACFVEDSIPSPGAAVAAAATTSKMIDKTSSSLLSSASSTAKGLSAPLPLEKIDYSEAGSEDTSVLTEQPSDVSHFQDKYMEGLDTQHKLEDNAIVGKPRPVPSPKSVDKTVKFDRAHKIALVLILLLALLQLDWGKIHEASAQGYYRALQSSCSVQEMVKEKYGISSDFLRVCKEEPEWSNTVEKEANHMYQAGLRQVVFDPFNPATYS